MRSYLLFTIGGRCFALPLDSVQRVVQMVEITSLPDAPEPICGAVNVQGETVPVFDLRRLCALEPAPPSPEHQLILAAAGDGSVALHVDATGDIVSLSEEKTTSLQGLISTKIPAEGIAPVSEDLVFIVDPKRLLAHARSAIGAFP